MEQIHYRRGGAQAEQTAVYSLLGVDKAVSPLYNAQHDVGILLNSLKNLFH